MKKRGDVVEPKHTLLQPGVMVDHYRVGRLLGRGAMGEVHLARDTHLGRQVALKVVQSDALGDKDALQRFLHEARVTARFSHPHIVTIFGVGEHQGCPYVALEYLPGQTLRDRVAEERPGVKESLRIGLAMAEALQEAHAHNVLHRDLKPSNVLLPRDGRLRVVDFGLAKLIESVAAPEAEAPGSPAATKAPGSPDEAKTIVPASSEKKATPETDATLPLGLPDSAKPAPPKATPFTSLLGEPGSRRPFESHSKGIRGTPAFMAPEQWAEQSVGPEADIWALGIILYELLGGRHPYASQSFFALGLIVCNSSPVPPISEAAPDLPKGIAKLVQRCLAKDPSHRPTAEAVVQTLRDLLLDTARRSSTIRAPFRGLLPFAERHADLFFGRESEIATFLERVREEAILPVVGPSGAGKSSFVQAGIIPRLREHAHWKVIRLRPGTRPFETLANRLLTSEHSGSRTSSGGGSLVDTGSRGQSTPLDRQETEQALARELRDAPTRLALMLTRLADQEQGRILLFVDQLEELYTLVSDETERRLFMQALCTSADDSSGHVRTVFTLRDDFLWRLAEGDAAQEALSRVTVLRPPGADQLVETLVRPLAKVGFFFESQELPQEMVAQVRGEPAALPLLQFAARQLWEQRDPEQRLLTEEAYRKLGGVAGALARHADGAVAALPAGQVSLARAIFLRLVTPENTRRVVSKSDLLDGLGKEAERVLQRFTAARAIVARKGRTEAELELVHESLITEWGRLATWLDESREEREFLTDVNQAAGLWEKRGRPPDEVWSGEALSEALHRAGRVQNLPEGARRFLDAGRHRSQRAQRRRKLALALGVGLLALIALAAVVVGWALRGKELEAQRQKRIAQARGRAADRERTEAVRQRAEAQREGARAALARGALVEARAKLRGALETRDSPLARALWWKLSGLDLVWRASMGATLYAVDFAPDGQTVAVASMDHAVHLLDVHTRSGRVLRGHTDQILTVAHSPDGRSLASATYAGEIRIWDLTTGRSRILRGHPSGVSQVAFSPDGTLLASAGADKTVRLWDVTTTRARAILKGHTGQVQSVAFSPDGRWLASAARDKKVRLWDVPSSALIHTLSGHTAAVQSVAFSPDGRRLLTASVDKTVRLWDVHQARISRVLDGHTSVVYRARFSPDGRWFASASADKTVRLWNAKTGQTVASLRGHTARVRDVAFSPDSRQLASASWDQSVCLWRVRPKRRSSHDQGHRAQVNGVGFSPDGRTVASASVDRSVRLWDVKTGQTRHVLKGHKATIWGVGFSPDSRLLASASSDKTVRLWDVKTGRAHRVLEGHTAQVWSVFFQPGGGLLASVSSDKTVRLWDVKTGTTRHVLKGHKGTIWNVAFDPKGRALATVSDDATVRVWRAPYTLGPAVLRGHKAAVYDVRFDPLGKFIASAGDDRTVRIWRRLGGVGPYSSVQTLGPHPGRAYNLDVDKSGRRVAVACSNGSGMIWDLEAGSAVTLRGHRAEVNAIRFSPDGRLAATTSDDGTVRVWQTRTGRPHWRAPLLRRDGSELLTHRGWSDPRSPTQAVVKRVATTAWRRAVQLARFADESAGGELLCVATSDKDLEMWSLAGDRRLRRIRLPGLRRVVALGGGCVALAAGKVRLLGRRATEDRTLARGGVALNRVGDGVGLAVEREVRLFGPRGTPRGRFPADVGITSLARVGDYVVVGFRDGGIELLPTREGLKRPSFVFEDTPSSPVVSLIPGPPGTLVAGFGNGVFGLWSLANGIRLEQRRIHGSVVHLVIRRGLLVAASELGQHATLDLGVFHLPYCELLQQVWRHVGVIWEKGLPRRRRPDPRHRCAR